MLTHAEAGQHKLLGSFYAEAILKRGGHKNVPPFSRGGGGSEAFPCLGGGAISPFVTLPPRN